MKRRIRRRLRRAHRMLRRVCIAFEVEIFRLKIIVEAGVFWLFLRNCFWPILVNDESAWMDSRLFAKAMVSAGLAFLVLMGRFDTMADRIAREERRKARRRRLMRER